MTLRSWLAILSRRRPVDDAQSPLAPTVERAQALAARRAGAARQWRRIFSLVAVLLLGVGGVLLWPKAGTSALAQRTGTSRHEGVDAVLPPLGPVPQPPIPAPRGAQAPLEELPSPALDRIGADIGALSAAVQDLPVDAPRERSPSAVSVAMQPAGDRRLAGEVFTRPAAAITVAGPQPGDAASTDTANLAVAGAQSGSLSRLLASDSAAEAKASLLPSRRLVLPRGSFIDCTLETAIDSSLPGLVTCVTAVDTFGADGTVVLLERGTKLVGETRGEVAPGAARVFVLWTQARTPQGVIIPLASPGTDALGRSGLPGSVERHFWDRFGAAILISMIDGAFEAAARPSAGGATVVLAPNGARDVMTEVLRSTVNIAPTVTKAQGDRIQILVARDLDFRPVYTLHARN